MWTNEYVKWYILNGGGTDEDQESYGFTRSFFGIAPIIVDYSTNNNLMKMKRNPMFNINEQQLNNQICEKICEK